MGVALRSEDGSRGRDWLKYDGEAVVFDAQLLPDDAAGLVRHGIFVKLFETSVAEPIGDSEHASEILSRCFLSAFIGVHPRLRFFLA